MVRNIYRRDVERAWLQALLEEHGRLCREVLQLNGLRRPNFAISPGLTQTWGHWDASRRCITFAGGLFETPDWEQLVLVLKHEMAHQIVSESFGLPQVEAHGEAFKRACAMLDIEPKATLDLPNTGGECKVSAKVRKLLALGQSPNAHEAELAVAKAHELALRHNINVLQERPDNEYTFRVVGPSFLRVPTYMWDICSILSDFYFVMYICRSAEDTHDNRMHRRIELYGVRDNLDLAEYVFYYLFHNGKLLWRRFKLEKRLLNNRAQRSYLRGFYAGVHQTLAVQQKHIQETKALVWLGDPGLEAFYRQRNPRVKTRMLCRRVYGEAHAAGMKDGKCFNIHKGLDGSRSKGRGISGLLT